MSDKNNDFDTLLSDHRNKRKRVRAVRAGDSSLAGRVVTINYEGRAIRVLFGVRRTPLWIEATSDNLEFVEERMRHAQTADELSAETDILPGGRSGSGDEQDIDDAGDDDDADDNGDA